MLETVDTQVPGHCLIFVSCVLFRYIILKVYCPPDITKNMNRHDHHHLTSSLKTSYIHIHISQKQVSCMIWERFPDDWKLFLLKIILVLSTLLFQRGLLSKSVSRTDVYSGRGLLLDAQPGGYGAHHTVGDV